MSQFTMTIDGEQVGSATDEVITNPATGAEVGRAPVCSAEQLDTAMHSAQTAWSAWKHDEQARRACLHACVDVLEAHVDDLATLLTAEQGKPLKDATAEVKGMIAWFRYYAGLELDHQVLQDDERALVEVVHKSLGVVAAIVPWNFPLLLSAWKVAPALLAGNTVVLKPSPFTPLSSLRFGEILASVLPPGVVNVISGGDALGPMVTAHPVPRKISFTGSVETGRLVASAATRSLKRVSLELGGNDAAILLDDVDPAAIARRLFWGAFVNNGQTCVAIKRLYVPERLYDAVVESVAAVAEAAVVGDGMDPATELGPINNRPQFDRVAAMVAEATRDGARVVAGGEANGHGPLFFRPTVLAGATHGQRVVDEEQFGPVLPILSYRSVQEAVEQANATPFGLAGSVWGTDEDRAQEVAGQLDCGTAWVNAHGALAPAHPFTGFKDSGLGTVNGVWGLHSFTEIQTRYTAKRR